MIELNRKERSMTLSVTLACVIGIVIGILLMAWAAAVGIRRLTVLKQPSWYGFQETIERLRAAVEKADGWVFPIADLLARRARHRCW